MVQVLPSVPLFGDKLIEALTGAAGNLATGYQQGQQKKFLNTALDTLANPNTPAVHKAALIAKMNPEQATILSQVFGPLLKEQMKGERENEQFNRFLPEFNTDSSRTNSGPAPSYANQFVTGTMPSQPVQPHDQMNGPPPTTPSEQRANNSMQLGAAGQAEPGLQGFQGQPKAEAPIRQAPTQPVLHDPTSWTDEMLVRAQALKGTPFEGIGKAEQQRRADARDLEESMAKRSQDQINSERNHEIAVQKLNLDIEKHKDSKTEKSEQRLIDDNKKLRENIETSGEEARAVLPSFEVAIQKVKDTPSSGPVTADAIFSALSESNPWFGNFLSSNAQQLEAQLPIFLEGFKDQMGGVLTDAKLTLLRKKTVGVGKDPFANLLAAYMPYYSKKLAIERQDIANQILKENNGVPPIDFSSQVNEKLRPYRKDIDTDLTRLTQNKLPITEFSNTGVNVQEQSDTFKSLNDIPDPQEGTKVMDDKTGQRYEYQNGRWKKLGKGKK